MVVSVITHCLRMTADEVVDAAQVFFHLSTTELVNLAHQAVEEVAVVAHQYHRAIESLYSLFQNILRWHVQMVGRLVKNEQVDGLQEQAYHRQPASFATRQHLNFLLRRFATEHKCTQQVVDFQSHVTRCHTVNGFVDCQFLIQQLCLVLCEITYLHVVTNLQCASIRNLTHDTFDQGRFTFAIFTDKGNLLPTFKGESNVFKHRMRAIIFTKFITNYRIITTSKAWGKLQVHAFVIHLIDLNEF